MREIDEYEAAFGHAIDNIKSSRQMLHRRRILLHRNFAKYHDAASRAGSGRRPNG
jgi:hypothetical protein